MLGEGSVSRDRRLRRRAVVLRRGASMPAGDGVAFRYPVGNCRGNPDGRGNPARDGMAAVLVGGKGPMLIGDVRRDCDSSDGWEGAEC